ncbi:hypothetical protein [Bradyrhizobium japonicum]|uniref:hypothetical protein n=1 Tax=Bradyrhizobium japonicum TaxID=375 RepID=UPI00209FB4B8|nr:hypothetical protein [Bradyrhizobium japonicum]MCP1766070.1 hypothetical protein [Bradyrhizobium japonicum]MCP1788207.1 hypothetical protein [Bradyrhizobium japonicum]MCP1810083.1 hypothetical protein [Bradyrhizobium japonicum]MCP1819017.1 hypothetical protein [Bradyrhizobium japonicum]MCP1869473.1 hypothetical protein [Bradyrhizobium japonicum]
MAKRSTKSSPPWKDGDPITVAKLEWCLDRLAHAMHRAPQGGEVYLPIFERLESELAAAKAKEAMLERARVRAARFMQEHSIKE